MFKRNTKLGFAHPRQPRLKPQMTGFTMLELLIVIAILTVLICIIAISLRRAKIQAHRTVCSAKLYEIAKGWHMYLDDNAGHFLKGINANWNYGGKQGAGGPAFGLDPDNPEHSIPKRLNPYLGLDEVVIGEAGAFCCPADGGGGDVSTTHYDHKGTSYVTNLMLVGQDKLLLRRSDPCRLAVQDANKLIGDVSNSQLFRPSKLILMGDAGWLNISDFAESPRINWHGKPAWHNIAFMDAHVEFVRIRKGLHVTPEYHTIPFESLTDQFSACQEERKND